MTAVSHCPRCGRRVFFAERKSSLGKDWHRQCLTCEACKKVLNPGQHSERKGIPYCEVPCYKSLFGPKLYGFGSTVESHTFNSEVDTPTGATNSGLDTPTGVTNSGLDTLTGAVSGPIHMSSTDAPQDLGSRDALRAGVDEATLSGGSLKRERDTSKMKPASPVNSSMNSPRIGGRGPKLNADQIEELQKKCDALNQAFPARYISLIQKEGYVTLEGSLRIHWGVQTPITFRQDNSESTPFTKRITGNGRVSKSRSFHNHISPGGLPHGEQPEPGSPDPFRTLRKSGMNSPQVTPQQLLAVKLRRDQFHTIKLKKVARRSSINGHYYRPEISDVNFTPAFGSVSNVYAASHLRTPQVIKRLLTKFQVENDASGFSLYLVKQNGEMWALRDEQQPLMERVQLNDLTTRVFLMDKPEQIAVARRHSSFVKLRLNETGNTTGQVMVGPELLDPGLVGPELVDPGREGLVQAALTGPSNATREISSIWRPVEDADLSKEVASFLGLPEPVLEGFLRKFGDDEEKARKEIEEKYFEIRRKLEEVMASKQMEEATFL